MTAPNDADLDRLLTEIKERHLPVDSHDRGVICRGCGHTGPWPCALRQLAAAVRALRTERDNWRAVARDICEEWSDANGAVCDAQCDSYGHEPACKATSIAAYLRALREENTALREQLREASVCSTCLGYPHPSGRVCICDGTGLASRELENTRKELVERQMAMGEYPAIPATWKRIAEPDRA